MTLQLNLISPNHHATSANRGIILNRTRTITFGLMATPMKPQTHNPVPPRANWPPPLRVSQGADQSSLQLIGNSNYW